MEIKIKQRFIGAAVILAIGAIFLPLLFHDPHPTVSSSMITTTPRAPDKPEAQLQLSQSLMAKEKMTEEKASAGVIPIPSESIITETKEKSNLSNSRSTLEPVSTISSGSQMKSNIAVATSQTLVLSTQSTEWNDPVKNLKIGKKIPIEKLPSSLNSLLSMTPKAWVIQVASFVNQDNVKRLLDRLQASGFDIYTRQSNEGKIARRIFVGPVVDYAKIIQIQKELKKMHLNGVIERYQTV
ncbi:MAG: SPOR domain-containing protein [Coxiella endosymbiont of Haemaphysalis japonica]